MFEDLVSSCLEAVEPLNSKTQLVDGPGGAAQSHLRPARLCVSSKM